MKTCTHLEKLEEYIFSLRIKVLTEGRYWGDDCGYFLYFDCVLNKESLTKRFNFKYPVEFEEWDGLSAGQEAGFYCRECKTGVVGSIKRYAMNKAEII